jgi:hypothetical protein
MGGSEGWGGGRLPPRSPLPTMRPDVPTLLSGFAEISPDAFRRWLLVSLNQALAANCQKTAQDFQPGNDRTGCADFTPWSEFARRSLRALLVVI